MLDLNALATFSEVAAAKSFSAAARRLGAPRSTVSLRIRSLEDALGVRLFKRSTRVMTLTADGRRLYEQAAEALSTLQKIDRDFGDSAAGLVGNIRITAPADFPTPWLASAITSFRGKHPEVTISLNMTNAVLDLVAEDIDLAIRVGTSNPQDYISRRLAVFGYGLFASPGWIATKGAPERLDLVHEFIAPGSAVRSFLSSTVFLGERLPQPAIETNDYRMIVELVLQDAGVGLMPVVSCGSALQDGRLVAVLEEAVKAPVAMTMSFPTRRDVTPRVRALADHLVATLPSSFLG